MKTMTVMMILEVEDNVETEDVIERYIRDWYMFDGTILNYDVQDAPADTIICEDVPYCYPQFRRA